MLDTNIISYLIKSRDLRLVDRFEKFSETATISVSSITVAELFSGVKKNSSKRLEIANKGYIIKEYFANYFMHTSDITFDMADNKMQVHHCCAEPWRVTLVDTGEHTQTGGRLRRVASCLGDQDAFCFTYGDGVADIDITELLAFHRQHGKWATITAVQPPGRYGALELDDTQVKGFVEKPPGDGAWINGGFFVLSPRCLSLITDDRTSWEGDVLTRLAARDEWRAYKHHGFWQPMDTLRDKSRLENLWRDGQAPWRQW